MERKRWNCCMACNQGGNLVECHTCTHASHAECSRNILINFADRRVVWRCKACEEDYGRTECSCAKQLQSHVQKKNNKQQRRTRQNIQQKQKKNNWESKRRQKM